MTSSIQVTPLSKLMVIQHCVQTDMHAHAVSQQLCNLIDIAPYLLGFMV